MLGNAIQFFIVLPIILVIRGLNPIYVMRQMGQAIAVALFTKSSAGTLPVTLACSEQNLKCNPRFPLRTAYLHHHQHERLRSFHSGNFSVHYAECRF